MRDPLDPDLQRRLDAACRYALLRRSVVAAFEGDGPVQVALTALELFLAEIGGAGGAAAARLQRDAEAGSPLSVEALARLDQAVMQGLKRLRGRPPSAPGAGAAAERIAGLKAALDDIPARVGRLSDSLDELRQLEAEAALNREAAAAFFIAGDQAGRRKALRDAKERLRQSLLDAPHSPLSDQRRALLAAWPED